jgi:hypothetical protein
MNYGRVGWLHVRLQRSIKSLEENRVTMSRLVASYVWLIFKRVCKDSDPSCQRSGHSDYTVGVTTTKVNDTVVVEKVWIDVSRITFNTKKAFSSMC